MPPIKFRADLRMILLGLALLTGACVAIANLADALIYGEVFLARRVDHATLSDAPVKFLMSVASSLVTAPLFLFAGVMLIRSSRVESRAFDERPGMPPLEDPRYTSRLDP